MVRYGVEPKRASVIHLGNDDASTRASWTQPSQAAKTLREARVMWTQAAKDKGGEGRVSWQQQQESNDKNAECWSGLVEWKCAYCGNVYIKFSGIMYSISVRCMCSA
jgi:hypothetical protein